MFQIRHLPICLALAVVCSGFAAAHSTASDGFTLEALMSAPFPSHLTASRQGRVAWVFNERGARNVWRAEEPDYRGRRWTSWTEDDGQTLYDLTWTADGESLLFVRGDGANRRGEFPNPLHLAEGTEQAVWIIGREENSARRLAEGHSPAPSPKGDGFAFLKKGSVWWRTFAATEETPVELIRPRGEPSALRWSPDGSKLLFVSGRGDHSFIGVYSADGKSVRYLDPSLDSDFNPVWSPDGLKIAFLRTPHQTAQFPFRPRRSASPWSVRVVDEKSGRAREIWKAPAGQGSAFRGIASESQLLWTADGFLVFPWEGDGWTHLYAVSVEGGEARLLTPGQFEVEEAALTPDGKTVFYSSNQADVDRRHLWSVSPAGGPPGRLTGGDGSEWSPTPLGRGLLAYLGSTARRPAQPWLHRNAEKQPLAPNSLPEEFPESSLVEPQQVVFPSADGLPIHGQLFLPPGESAAKRPAVLYFHGGSRRQMLLGWHYLGYYHNCYAMNQYLASRGYVVLSVNYRSGIGYGLEFREALNYGAAGASEFNDVLGAGLYLKNRPDVDGARIGVWGGSYGGYLTALALARASELFAAGVDLHGVHDWNKVIQNFVPSYNPLEYPNQARRAFESSPMASVDDWRSPVLLIHGDDDRNVPFSESVELAAQLRERGVTFEQVVLPDEVHSFLTHRNWLRVFAAAADFFERHLARRP